MIQIAFQQDWGRNGWQIFVRETTATGQIPYRVTIERLPEIGKYVRMDESTFLDGHVAEGFIQALIEGLQRSSLMPKATSVEAELNATKNHLEDMRALVFNSGKPK